jgi:hypothetical protein
MLCLPPYNTWPLRVKIFREEALKEWEKAAKYIPKMPEGFSLSLELEGVDGNSGHRGSGRGGPIDVRDREDTSHRWNHANDFHLVVFATEHVGKWESMKERSTTTDCAVCSEPVHLTAQV